MTFRTLDDLPAHARQKFELMEGVERTMPVSHPYKLASREFHPDNTLVPLNDHQVGEGTQDEKAQRLVGVPIGRPEQAEEVGSRQQQWHRHDHQQFPGVGQDVSTVLGERGLVLR